jgi:hypothetical protein
VDDNASLSLEDFVKNSYRLRGYQAKAATFLRTMTPREEPHNQHSSAARDDGCLLRIQPDGRLAFLDGKQIIAAMVPGPMIIYLADAEVDPELGGRRTTHATTVRRLPSTQLLQILAHVPGSLG